MEYLLTFLEGLASFVSPCVLPMIPLYLSYLAGDDETEEEHSTVLTDENKKIPENEEKTLSADTDTAEIIDENKKADKKADKKKNKVILRSLFFVLGFTLMFVVFGGLVGLISGYISAYKSIINVIAGIIVIVFGLSYVGFFGLPFFKGLGKTIKIGGIGSAFLFGIVFAVGVGPCTGAFLGSALLLASTSGTIFKGVVLLLFYSLGIGIPFILTAVLTDRTKKLFAAVKQNFKIVKIVSGSLLILMGALMATGVIEKLGSLLA